MSEVVRVHAGEDPPAEWTASLFLAGPTPRSPEVPSWRPAALAEIERTWDRPGKLVVFIPEPRGAVWPVYDDQRTWELHWGDRADVVLFWIARGPGMPALTTNDEFGRWKDSGRVVLGTPPDAERVRYQREYAREAHVPLSDTLPDTIAAAMKSIEDGASRRGGARDVPLLVWRTPSFQHWLRAHEAAGNDLRGGRLEWTFRVGPDRDIVFLWAFHAQIHVAAEDRVKTNEIVLSRPDVAAVLAYRRAPELMDTRVVLVREFRSPTVSPDGFVHELPSGSSHRPMPPVEVAALELAEETGLDLPLNRFRAHHARQLAATFSAHRQHLFSVELTADELDRIDPAARGVPGHSERTYPEVWRLGDLVSDPRADWTTLGALMEVLVSGLVPGAAEAD
ncbi:unknown [Alloactinosynnema sp. L-07]|uniref:nucleoside 2-deoxyribosyltransferase domain-containing protein n=1 Tax=Alloactinosynnema sp. L-07 TaxID=1653480 RepID=UPI00065F04CA|nr:nucleoside 2-deoxyribosyltransferase domain-containing protein [Alloactinosynnema sp. L-07]CRK56135.1 unknown [Alloactinosynnema sp. L-07]